MKRLIGILLRRVYCTARLTLFVAFIPRLLHSHTGKGSFRHDGAFVGTFDIPPVTATAMSVTDMMIIAHFSPERWSALSISAEYYRGKLILDVDVAVSVRVPALFDYSISTKLENLEVHVNEMSDRHLCQCPDWSEAKNNTPPAWLLL